MRYIEAGLASTGDAFLDEELITSGVVHWVHSGTGNDANPGTYELPLATLAQAVTNATASNGDIVVLKSGHAETLTSAVVLSKAGVKFFGLGSGSSAPSFTCNAAVDLIQVTAADVEINNFYFPAATTGICTGLIDAGAADLRIKGCTFVCGEFTQYAVTVPAAGTNLRIENCQFSVSADGPDAGVIVESASATGLYIANTTFDGGTYNWDDAALYSTVGHLRFVYDSVTLTNYARMRHTSSSAKGIASNLIVDAGGEVSFA